MDPAYAAAYRDLYERHWWWRARERFLLDRLEAQAESGRRSNRRILDIGCGDALFFAELSRFGTVRGVEPDRNLLSDGPWRGSIHAGTLESLPAEAPYDWLLMLDVLEHLTRPEEILLEARKLAAADAVLHVTVPAFQSLWTRHDDLNQHYRRYDESSLSDVLTATGWKPVETTFFFHWLVPGKVLIRLKERLVSGDPKVEKVPPGPLNKVLLAVSLIEQKLSATIHVPFGTSLYIRCEASKI